MLGGPLPAGTGTRQDEEIEDEDGDLDDPGRR
jgi:hypothetical protein